MRHAISCLATLALTALAIGQPFEPIGPMMGAHNCYPYHGEFEERLQTALTTGGRIAIEQDLCWVTLPGESEPRSLVAHNGPFTGHEPTLEAYFFEQVRPMIEAALDRADADPAERDRWPLIILELDVKDKVVPHAEAIDDVLSRYAARGWLTTAVKTGNDADRSPLDLAPIMVVTGCDAMEEVCYERTPVGERFHAFGFVPSQGPATNGLSGAQRNHAFATFPPERMIPDPATNYHRWWNSHWRVVEAGGPRRAGDWTRAEAQRLQAIVDHANAMGYWTRFYTINGCSDVESDSRGMSSGYNTGVLERARIRWQAMREAGVDIIATDQYAEFASHRDESAAATWPVPAGN